MKKIFLCSYFAEVASILSESVSVPLRGKTVAFIPTASIHERIRNMWKKPEWHLILLDLLLRNWKLLNVVRMK